MYACMGLCVCVCMLCDYNCAVDHTACVCVCFSFGFTFLVNHREEKGKNSCFGHCVCLSSEEEMYRWVAALLVAQVLQQSCFMLF